MTANIVPFPLARRRDMLERQLRQAAEDAEFYAYMDRADDRHGVIEDAIVTMIDRGHSEADIARSLNTFVEHISKSGFRSQAKRTLL